jgi:hypothetical protein
MLLPPLLLALIMCSLPLVVIGGGVRARRRGVWGLELVSHWDTGTFALVPENARAPLSIRAAALVGLLAFPVHVCAILAGIVTSPWLLSLPLTMLRPDGTQERLIGLASLGCVAFGVAGVWGLVPISALLQREEGAVDVARRYARSYGGLAVISAIVHGIALSNTTGPYAADQLWFTWCPEVLLVVESLLLLRAASVLARHEGVHYRAGLDAAPRSAYR